MAHYEETLRRLLKDVERIPTHDLKGLGLGNNKVTVSYLGKDGRIQEKSSDSFAVEALAERAFRMIEWYYFKGPIDKITDFEIIWFIDFRENHFGSK